jgi:hypothetical protein
MTSRAVHQGKTSLTHLFIGGVSCRPSFVLALVCNALTSIAKVDVMELEVAEMVTYEQQMGRDLEWVLREGSLHFEKENAVHKALRKIAKRLTDLGIPYAFVGGMALFYHGVRRFTEGVDILVTPDGLKEVHRHLEGLEYVPLFQGSKHLRDAEFGVKVEFLTTGDYPGDGRPKPVAFPNPAECAVEIEGYRLNGINLRCKKLSGRQLRQPRKPILCQAATHSQ